MADKKPGLQSHMIILRAGISAVLIAAFIFMIFISQAAAGNEIREAESSDEFTIHLDKRISDLMDEYDIPGVNIALVEKGKVTWSKAYGYADLEEKRKMTTDTVCRVESISKSVTAWGIMKLAEQGKIDLDKPISQYLKSWELPPSGFSEDKVTVRHLLTHTSGMPLGDVFERYSPKEKVPSLKESLSKQAVLIREPGTSFSYSNTGYNLLELLIEEVTGKDFSEYMQADILNPLGMKGSSFVWSDKYYTEVPMGYDLQGSDVPVYVYPEKASGGLFATAEDIAAFLTAGMTDYSMPGVLTLKSINEIYTPKVDRIGVYSLVFDSYGFGHYIENLSDGNTAVSHGGQGGGIMTHFHSIPETGDSIVILTNSQRSWPFIAHILTDWAKWLGFDSIGMGKIILGQRILWMMIVVVWLAILWRISTIAQGIIARQRRFSLLSRESQVWQLLQAVLSIILISGLLWSISQDYLFISSVFPIASGWLGLSGLVLAAVLMISALFPSHKR